MERLWSQAGAKAGNPSQTVDRQTGLNDAHSQTFATDGNQPTFDGKEGVRGSSPREGFTNPLLTSFLVVG